MNMNRVIKFRGKRFDNGEWVYGLLFYSHGLGTYRITASNGWVPSYNNPDEGESTVHYDVDPSTVGQFTGLLDKDGKEIYEGDVYKRILDKSNRYKKDHEWADYWLVSWIKTDCCFTTTCIGNNEDGKFVKEDGWASKTNPYSKRFDEFDQYIGNIHDNPELLK